MTHFYYTNLPVCPQAYCIIFDVEACKYCIIFGLHSRNLCIISGMMLTEYRIIAVFRGK